MKVKLKNLNINVFGNIQNNVTLVVSKLDNIQSILNIHGLTDEHVDQETRKKFDLQLAISLEKTFWKEKSKSK